MNGILIVCKPFGLTSRDVVNYLSKLYNVRKVGHTGTLDPMATGVLVVCFGTYTKLVNLFTSYDKEYVATMRLGFLTDTLDTTGNVILRKDFNINDYGKMFFRCPFSYSQTVPLYSASKVNGKKLYEYARANEDVVLPKKNVTIYSLDYVSHSFDSVTFKAVVSKGTYIRSLINDMALSINTVATMSALRRVRQGIFRIEDSYELDCITKDTPLLKADDLFPFPIVDISFTDYKKVLNGNVLQLDVNDERVFVSYDKKKVAIYEKKDDGYHILLRL